MLADPTEKREKLQKEAEDREQVEKYYKDYQFFRNNMVLEYLDFDPHNFWFRVFDSLPFTKRSNIAGYRGFEIPFYEAVYLTQLLNPSRETILQPNPHLITYANNNKDPVIIPPASAGINTPHTELGQKTQLNPLFAPSLTYISSKYPEFFADNKKFLIIHELGSETNIHKICEDFLDTGYNLSQLIIFDMSSNWYNHKDHGVGANRAYVAEPIMEYLASAHFRARGYIVDKFETDLSGSRKHLDLFAIKCPSIQNTLKRYGLINNGLYLCELESPLWKNNKSVIKQDKQSQEDNITIVIEAESSRRSEYSGYMQVKIDLEYGEFNYGYIAAPFIENSSHKDEIGIVTISTKGKLIVHECPKDWSDKEKVSILLKRVERIVKLCLLKNIPLKKTLKILPPIKTFWEIYSAIDDVPLEKIIALIDSIKQ